jgi:hypothetical protein
LTGVTGVTGSLIAAYIDVSEGSYLYPYLGQASPIEREAARLLTQSIVMAWGSLRRIQLGVTPKVLRQLRNAGTKQMGKGLE